MAQNPELYRIIARDPNGSGQAYAEHIRSFKSLGNGRVMVTDLLGTCYFADMNDIIINPRVIKACAGGPIFKIIMEGDI